MGLMAFVQFLPVLVVSVGLENKGCRPSAISIRCSGAEPPEKKKRTQMSPCGYLHSNLRDTTSAEVNFVNTLVCEEHCCEELAFLHTHCRKEIILILQRLIICSDTVIDILNKSPKVDQSKSSAQKILCQCCNPANKCGSSSSPLVQDSLLKCNNFGKESSRLSKFPEISKSLQHGMAQHVSGVDNNEAENDSGFNEDSGGQHRRLPSFDSRNDIEKLERNEQELSQCCFYFGSLDSQTAKRLLRVTPIGTFLIRDSSHYQYLYSLSVKTERGATSVRVIYNNGLFQFDSDERIRSKLPQFDSVVGLLDFHVMITRDGVNKSWQWEENSSKKGMKVTLTKPLRSSVPSLAHLSRVKINQCLCNSFLPHQVDGLPLISNRVKDFIKDYPYRI